METCCAIIEQGPTKGSRCLRPPKQDGFCGKHMTAALAKKILSAGKYFCYTNRCMNVVDSQKTYCDSCKYKKELKLATNQCQAYILIGSRKGLKCTNSTYTKYCGKHNDRTYLRELAKSLGKTLCGNGARCTNMIDLGDKTKCESCLEKQRHYDRITYEIKKNDLTMCIDCGKITTEFATTKYGNVSRYCEDCYVKMRSIEDGRNRKVSVESVSHPTRYYESYKNHAHRKGIDFELTYEQFMEICGKSCTYCGYYNELEYNGVDRLDSKHIYTFDNCTSSCKTCNYMKSNYDTDLFISHVKSIVSLQKSNVFIQSPLVWKGTNDTSYESYKSQTFKRKLEFEVSSDLYWEMKSKKCYLCGSVPVTGSFNGIDRIDSTKGYLLDNIAPCCVYCNRMKLDTMLSDFIDQCEKINQCAKHTVP